MKKNIFKTIFKYIEPMWCGFDGKISLKAVLAIAFAVDFINNLSFAIRHWEIGKSFADLAMLLGIEAGLIMGFLGITAWTNMAAKKIEFDASQELTK